MAKIIGWVEDPPILVICLAVSIAAILAIIACLVFYWVKNHQKGAGGTNYDPHNSLGITANNSAQNNNSLSNSPSATNTLSNSPSTTNTFSNSPTNANNTTVNNSFEGMKEFLAVAKSAGAAETRVEYLEDENKQLESKNQQLANKIECLIGERQRNLEMIASLKRQIQERQYRIGLIRRMAQYFWGEKPPTNMDKGD